VGLVSLRVARRRLVSLYLQQLGTMPFLADHLLSSFFLYPSNWLTPRIGCAFIIEDWSERSESFMRSIEAWKP
jgi:hypothetical protein